MIGLECLHTTAGISERSDVIRAFPKRSTSSCNFARSAPGLDHEVKHSKRNSISTHAHVIFSIYYVKSNVTCKSTTSSDIFMAVVLLHETVFQGQSLSQNLINSLNMLIAKQV